MASATFRRSFINYFGILILLVGMSVGNYKYWRSLQDDVAPNDEELLLSEYNSKAYQQAVQRNVGVFGMLVNQWSLDLAELGEPRPLAITIWVVSCLAAAGCFLVAARIPRA